MRPGGARELILTRVLSLMHALLSADRLWNETVKSSIPLSLVASRVTVETEVHPSAISGFGFVPFDKKALKVWTLCADSAWLYAPGHQGSRTVGLGGFHSGFHSAGRRL